MMTALIDASRQAAGFREAIRAALEALRTNLGAHSVVLLEAGSEELRATASAPDQGWGACAIPRNGLLANRLRAYGAPLPVDAGELDAGKRWAARRSPSTSQRSRPYRRAACDSPWRCGRIAKCSACCC